MQTLLLKWEWLLSKKDKERPGFYSDRDSQHRNRNRRRFLSYRLPKEYHAHMRRLAPLLCELVSSPICNFLAIMHLMIIFVGSVSPLFDQRHGNFHRLKLPRLFLPSHEVNLSIIVQQMKIFQFLQMRLRRVSSNCDLIH